MKDKIVRWLCFSIAIGTVTPVLLVIFIAYVKGDGETIWGQIIARGELPLLAAVLSAISLEKILDIGTNSPTLKTPLISSTLLIVMFAAVLYGLMVSPGSQNDADSDFVRYASILLYTAAIAVSTAVVAATAPAEA